MELQKLTGRASNHVGMTIFHDKSRITLRQPRCANGKIVNKNLIHNKSEKEQEHQELMFHGASKT